MFWLQSRLKLILISTLCELFKRTFQTQETSDRTIKWKQLGSGCGTVGRAVASAPDDPGLTQAMSSFIKNINLLKNQGKENGNVPFLWKNESVTPFCVPNEKRYQRTPVQCDPIGQFFAFWASIQSRWHQLFYPNHPHFCKGVQIIHFSSEIIFGPLL